MALNGCALNTGEDFHLLDHIAPLASLLNIPLIVTEEENDLLSRKYYPEVATKFWPNLEFRLAEIAEKFDILFACKHWSPHLKTLFRTLFQKEMRLIFCPHGQSDKGYRTPILASYALHDGVLIYGDLLKKMLIELNIWNAIASHSIVGNYRWLYFQKHRQRLRRVAETEIFSQLKPRQRTLLYAPTWQDADHATSFFRAIEYLSQASDWNVIVKVHPLLEQRSPALFYRLTASLKNVLLVHKFPLVYPILERIDAYLGDYSSVGYDVLALQKPMFFLPQSHLPPARLHACGQVVSLDNQLFQTIEKGLGKNFISQQAALYAHAFNPVTTLDQIIQDLAGEEHRPM